MVNFIVEITDYLNKEVIIAKDIIIISVISTLVGTIVLAMLKDAMIKLKDFVVIKFLKPTVKKIKKGFKKYIMRKPTIRELLEIQDRLNAGGKLKWYEEKEYNRQKEAIENFGKSFKGLECNFGEITERMEIHKIKPQELQTTKSKKSD